MPFVLRPGPAPAVTALVRSGVGFTLHPWSVEDADEGAGVADVLGVAPDRVLDTIVVDCLGRLVACVVPSDSQFDPEGAAAALSAQAVRPALEAVAERATGQPAAATSPFGHRRRMKVLVDDSVWRVSLRRPTTSVYVATGQPGLHVEVAVGDLLALTEASRAFLAVHRRA